MEKSDARASSARALDAERCITKLQRGRAIAPTHSQQRSSSDATNYQIIQLVEELGVSSIKWMEHQ